MNATILKQDKTEVQLSFEVSKEMLEKGLAFAYNKRKNQISIPGFRKGKVPRKLVESQYGEGFFYEDAINHIFPETYGEALDELQLDVVSAPSLDVDYIESGKGAKFIVDVTIKPEVTLGEYKGLPVERETVSVTEEEVSAELASVQSKNARKIEVTDRAAELGDIVKLSYAGSVDGVPFDGGQSDAHDLELGSKQFIPGFEEQVVGHSVGDAFDITVTFPEAYHSEDLAGKEAIFAIVIQSITAKELPALDDAFAEDVSEFDTLDAYKADILAKLQASKEEKAKQAESDKLLDVVIANTTMEVPEVMYETKVESMIKEFSDNIGRQGLTLDIYCQYMGTTKEDMKETFRETSVKSVNARLVLEAVAKAEGLCISDEDLKAEICKYGESYGIDEKTILELFREEDKKSLEEDMVVRAALKLIEDTAVDA